MRSAYNITNIVYYLPDKRQYCIVRCDNFLTCAWRCRSIQGCPPACSCPSYCHSPPWWRSVAAGRLMEGCLPNWYQQCCPLCLRQDQEPQRTHQPGRKSPQVQMVCADVEQAPVEWPLCVDAVQVWVESFLCLGKDPEQGAHLPCDDVGRELDVACTYKT